MTHIETVLADEADTLLHHQCTTIPKNSLVLPGPDFVDRGVALSDRRPRTLRSLQTFFNHGRLAGTGYLSILKGLNIRQVPFSPPIQSTSTLRTSFG